MCTNFASTESESNRPHSVFFEIAAATAVTQWTHSSKLLLFLKSEASNHIGAMGII